MDARADRRPEEPSPLVAVQRGAGNAATAALVQRLIFKDEKALTEGRPYKNITKVRWYLNLSDSDRDIAMRLHKNQGSSWTVDQANHEIAQRRGQQDDEADEDEGYASDVEHGRVPEVDRLLTPEEFAALPERGTINPYRIRTAQGGIELNFREQGRPSVPSSAQALADNPDLARDYPPVELGVHDGRVWSFDTRRVVTHQMARRRNQAVEINYVKIGEEAKADRVGSIFTPRPFMGLVTTVRNDGTKGGSVPHINPAYEGQLEHVHIQWDYSSHEPLARGGFGRRPQPVDAEPEMGAEEVEGGDRAAQVGDAADRGAVGDELRARQDDFDDWVSANENVKTTQRQREHARAVADYIRTQIAKGAHESMPNGWLLEEVRDVASGLSRRMQVHYLWSWRIPKAPDRSPQPLFRWLHGG